MANKLPKWDDERTATLEGLVSSDEQVTQAQLETIAAELETSKRSVSSKLRKMGYDVELASAAAKAKSFSDEQEAALSDFLENNSGEFTYAEVAEQLDGDFTAKQVQGKILSMELTGHVKPTPKKETVKSYTDEEEAKFINMANDGAFLEEIKDALGKELNSVRGKALSLMRAGDIESIPKQRDLKAKGKSDPFEGIDDLASFTVEQLAEQIGKTVRGVKTMLTRRGLTVQDYDGAARKAKAEA